MTADLTDSLYDKIGKTYDRTRKSDPIVLSKLLSHLAPKIGKSYLDIGCGSGNYTHEIYEKGFHICGLDISRHMLELARKKNQQVEWVHGDARKMPFPDRVFHGAICVLATHHIQDLDKAFREVYRVLHHGTFVIFTALPEHMKKWWLFVYFPHLMRRACSYMASFDRLSHLLRDAQFHNIRSDKFFIPQRLEDKILYSGKYNPEIYLDPLTRSGISQFTLKENQDEIQRGCARLQHDIASGKIEHIIQDHESDLGDYTFIMADKLNR